MSLVGRRRILSPDASSARASSKFACKLSQNSGSTPKQCPKRKAVSPVTDLFPLMIWLTRLGGTSIWRAISLDVKGISAGIFRRLLLLAFPARELGGDVAGEGGENLDDSLLLHVAHDDGMRMPSRQEKPGETEAAEGLPG